MMARWHWLRECPGRVLMLRSDFGCYIEDNRNGCVQHAIDTGIDFDWLFWIDGDMIFPTCPHSHDRARQDIVGATTDANAAVQLRRSYH